MESEISPYLASETTFSTNTVFQPLLPVNKPLALFIVALLAQLPTDAHHNGIVRDYFTGILG